MPPAQSNLSESKSKAFKPPRPSNTNSRASKASSSTKPTPRRKSASARLSTSHVTSSSDESLSAHETTATTQLATAQVMPGDLEAPLTLPPKLLTRLLVHHFTSGDTKLGREARALVGVYMDTFVREALARAAFERAETGKGGGAADFLEVEDLEKLAPQLILDF